MKWGKKWVVFVTAPDQVTGEMWCAMLRESGINCQLRDSNPSFIGPSLYPVRLMAPEEQSDLAFQLLEREVKLGPMNAIYSRGRNDSAAGPAVNTEHRASEPNSN